jgi:predicted transcriptional regulator
MISMPEPNQEQIKRILAYLKHGVEKSTTDIASNCGLLYYKASNLLTYLEQENKVFRHSSDRSTKWRIRR